MNFPFPRRGVKGEDYNSKAQITELLQRLATFVNI